MPHSPTYRSGTPCWVETMQPDPQAAQQFYAALMGWSFDDDTARLEGLTVAGLSQAPPGSPALWAMFVAVDDLEAATQELQAAGGTVLAGPVPRPPAGRYSVVADPSGVAFCLWQGEERRGAEMIAEPHTWAMSSLHTPDPQKAATFYCGLFGWELEPGPAFTRCRLDGRIVAVISGTGPGTPPHWAVVFAAADVDELAATAVTLGGTCLVPPMDTPEHRGAVLMDPQGAVFSVTTPAAPGEVR